MLKKLNLWLMKARLRQLAKARAARTIRLELANLKGDPEEITYHTYWFCRYTRQINELERAIRGQV